VIRPVWPLEVVARPVAPQGESHIGISPGRRQSKCY